MQHYSGIDEAGLGPILGPFCATATTFKSPVNLKKELSTAQKKIFYVDDSKKVYQGKYGLKKLEENILAFFSLLYDLPNNSLEFIPSLQTKWAIESPVKIPIVSNKDEILKKRDNIYTFLNQRDIKLVDIKRTAISAYNFNLLIDKYNNKSIACQKIIDPLIINSLSYYGELTVDKQGGRKFYKDYLNSLTNKETFTIVKEDNNLSRYQSNFNQVNFMAKADSESFEVALASMFSKYMREIAMNSFNNYWKNKIPEIKKTAGYYTDGIRFVNELVKEGQLPKNRDSIIRKK